jgi:hypothetical protein
MKAATRASPPSGRIAVFLFCVGGFLLVGLPVAWHGTHAAVDVGSLPARAGQAADGGVLTPSGKPPPIVQGASADRTWLPSEIRVQSARLPDAEAMQETVKAPVEVSIGALGVRARVIPVGVVQARGTMEVPRDVSVVGWYRFGPSPGGLGSAILVGHVDSRAQGRGAFFRLARLPIGASIFVKSGDGRKLAFKVVARRSYPKDRLPNRIFDRMGPPTLTLVTCGGTFDERTRRYADNIVIFAVGR